MERDEQQEDGEELRSSGDGTTDMQRPWTRTALRDWVEGGEAESIGLGLGGGGRGSARLRDDSDLDGRWPEKAGVIHQAGGEHFGWTVMNLKCQLSIRPESRRCCWNLHPGCLGQGGYLFMWTFRAGPLAFGG